VQEELQDFCNLGYAERCVRLPRERTWDSIRFGARIINTDDNRGTIQRVAVRYVCERAHLPVEHGFLEFDAAKEHWPKRHTDTRLQRMAECFLETYLEKRKTDPGLATK
jgi:hypothetical protein